MKANTNVNYISDSVALQITNDLENALHREGVKTERLNISRRDAAAFRAAAANNIGTLKQVPEMCTPDFRIGCAFKFMKGDPNRPSSTLSVERRSVAQRCEFFAQVCRLGEGQPTKSMAWWATKEDAVDEAASSLLEKLETLAAKRIQNMEFRCCNGIYSYQKK